MTRLREIAIACLAVLGLLGPQSAAAYDFIVEVIPASSCEPTTGWAKVEMASSAWQFVPGEIGTVEFRCPVLSSYFHYDLAQTKVPSVISAISLHYADPDGPGVAYEVKATLHRSTKTQSTATSVGTTLSSNSEAALGDNYYELCILNACSVHTMLDAQYFIEVVLRRTDTTANPRLTAAGIRYQPAN